MKTILGEQIKKIGFCVVPKAIDEDKIDKFNFKHLIDKQNTKEAWSSYLPSRNAYIGNSELIEIMCSEMLDNFAKELNVDFSIHMVEARFGSSNIQWHRDFNPDMQITKNSLDSEKLTGDHYFGAIIALEDFGINCGPFEIAEYSHKWEIDNSIVNHDNMMNNPKICYDYYSDLIKQKNAKTYEFFGKKGDFIIWHGSAIHRGKQSPLEQHEWNSNETSFRNTLFFHFAIPDVNEITKPGQNTQMKVQTKERLYLALPNN